MDELALLWDEELAVMDPDSLPRRLITDFSVYNAEVRFKRVVLSLLFGFCAGCWGLAGSLRPQRGAFPATRSRPRSHPLPTRFPAIPPPKPHRAS